MPLQCYTLSYYYFSLIDFCSHTLQKDQLTFLSPHSIIRFTLPSASCLFVMLSITLLRSHGNLVAALNSISSSTPKSAKICQQHNILWTHTPMYITNIVSPIPHAGYFQTQNFPASNMSKFQSWWSNVLTSWRSWV